MFYYVYQTTNKINNKIYVGAHKSNSLSDGYMGSGTLLRRAIKKYGVESFEKVILEFFDSETAMFEYEKTIVDSEFVLRSDTYNITEGGFGGDRFTTHPDKERIREQMRQRTGDKNGMYGKSHTESSKQLISKNKKGQRKGIPTWNKGKTLTPEHKEKMSLSKRGANNHKSKCYIFTSPDMIKTEVNGSFDCFCESHTLPVTTARYYVGKGVVPPPKGRYNPIRHNLTGWKIELLTTK